MIPYFQLFILLREYQIRVYCFQPPSYQHMKKDYDNFQNVVIYMLIISLKIVKKLNIRTHIISLLLSLKINRFTSILKLNHH